MHHWLRFVQNSKERVEMGSFRFIFAFLTSLIIQSITVQFVRMAGGGAAAWRTVAIIYAVIGLIVNTISVFSIKELPEEELKAGREQTEEKYGLIEAAKLLFSNKYYLMICVTYICQQIYSAMLNMGIYYMIYVLKMKIYIRSFPGQLISLSSLQCVLHLCLWKR